LLKEYDPLFTSSGEENEPKEEVSDEGFDRWNWTGVIFELCDKDITKIDMVTDRNIIETMNWLSYHKEKNEILKKQMQQNGKNL